MESLDGLVNDPVEVIAFLEIFYGQIEYDFHNFKIKNHLFHKYPEGQYDYKIHRLMPIKVIDPIKLNWILGFIENFDKVLFKNIDFRPSDEVNEYLLKVQKHFFDKKEFLNTLIRNYAFGLEDNRFQVQFYNHLIHSIALLIKNKHKGQIDRSAFLSRPNRIQPDDAKFLQYKFLSKEKIVIKPLCLKSPQSIINGFQSLAEDGKVAISNIEAFVYSSFEFKSTYEMPDSTARFTFNWLAPKHVLTQLMVDLKLKKSIELSQNQLIQWILYFIKVSPSSIEKYSSGQKVIAPRNRIDLQLFST